MHSHEMTGCLSHVESTGLENDCLSISRISFCPHVAMAENVSSDYENNATEGSTTCSTNFFLVRKRKRNFLPKILQCRPESETLTYLRRRQMKTHTQLYSPKLKNEIQLKEEVRIKRKHTILLSTFHLKQMICFFM